ncbi:adaptin N terminal region-domain-containing protein [Radiomyces spectabilis]|uniref:adaptin N terminal region-domain-containing protein n=1 Tax=Radiomyces spectabilis TaxID=64574 RepID=UPI00221F79E5|nr:adaptin N terminal region-domain-containing protein [Radiomyces spectabilis]KAI8373125.1 adaptin N terminal region-domain-containing protein [Radiomyces spectabilis]
MFEKSLTDLIRGIRANKKNEQKYIAVCLQDIRNEVKSNDSDIKATAVAKLTYLQMLGYDMSWASFHIVEVMSSPKFIHKRTGYLAATQSFQQDTDVLMLTTNLIKKDLASPTALDIGIAVNGLSHIVTPELARDLCQDLVAMLNHSRPYIRKRVVLVLYKVFLKFPEALRLSFPRIKEKLEDPDPSVVSSVVSVICELARKNPKNYLSLAPQLFKLLTTSSNNWMLIKIIKLFASLTPHEPRLIKKLLPPLTSLIQTTPAMSLLYECIYTVITGGFLEAAGDASHALAMTCATKLRKFLEDADQNLKYVGLLAMGKLLLTHPRLVAEHKDIILECIDDDDMSIRIRALDLVVGMVNRKNTIDIVKRLVAHLSPVHSTTTPESLHEASTILDPVYRTDIVNRILFICGQNQYHNITNFEWYISVLVGMIYTSGVSVGESLKHHLMDVAVRVKSVREYAVKEMFRLLGDKQTLETAKRRDSNIEVLAAAAWVCGEYCNFLDDIPATLERLLTPYVVKMPMSVQIVYVQNIMKIYAYWVSELIPQWNAELQEEFVKVTHVMREKLQMFIQSSDLEVQERACNMKAIFDLILSSVEESAGEQAPPLLQGLPDLFFIYELNPVAPKAQKKVPIPEGLDLDAWINEPLPELVDDDDSDDGSHDGLPTETRTKRRSNKSKKAKAYSSDEDEEDRQQRRNARLEAIRNDPYYIASDKKDRRSRDQLLELEDDVDSIPIVTLSMDDIHTGSRKKKGKKQSTKKRRARLPTPPPPIYAEEEMPENAADSASDNDTSKKPTTYTKKNGRDIFATDEDQLHDVDLSKPLGEDEQFPQIQAYLSPEEVRRREELQARARRKEQRALSRQQENEPAKSSKKSSPKEGSSKSGKKEKKTKKESSTKKSKKSKKRDSGDHQEPPSMPPSLDDNVRHALADGQQTETKSPQSLFSNDQVDVSYTMELATDATDATDAKENPAVAIRFIVRNKTTDLMLPRLQLHFNESLDLKPMETKEGSELASVSETFEMQAGETIECMGVYQVQGGLVPDMVLRGELQYDVEGSYELHQHGLELRVPVSVFFLKSSTLDPASFASLLAEHGAEFEYQDSVTVQVPEDRDASVEQTLIRALASVSLTSGLHVVEVVPGAASLYAQSVNGAHVAGLLKYVLETEGDTPGLAATITVTLKSTDEEILKGIATLISSISVQ